MCLGILYPQTCPVCDKIVKQQEKLICSECRLKLSYVKEPTCMKCGKSVGSNRVEFCFDCKYVPKSFERNIALVHYTPIVSKALSKVKYYNRRQNLDFFCEELLRRHEKKIKSWHGQVLIPVPIHSSRRRQRGFNQAEEIGKRLQERLEIPMDCDVLIRTKKTLPQKELNDKERLRNLKQAFAIRTDIAQKYDTVILLDDIYTTGSTAEACTRVLKQAGIKKVYMITIAIGKGK